MFETLIIWAIIALCAYFVSARFLRQFRAAMNKDADLSCGCGCSGCNINDCDDREEPASYPAIKTNTTSTTQHNQE